jgi:hypothetical protein
MYLSLGSRAAVDCGELICSQHLDSAQNQCYVCDLLEGCGDQGKTAGLRRDHCDQSSTEDL